MINWIVRYAKILSENRELFDPANSVLEVGSGATGIAQYLKRKVTGLEPAFPGPVNEWLQPATGSVLNIPFPDASFDYVICVDMLEHLSAAERPRAIAEMVRVARAKVIMSCPTGTAAIAGEQHLRGFFDKYFIPIPAWLTEHSTNGLPSVADILTEMAKTGLPFELSGNETITQHYAGLILDYVFPMADVLKSELLTKTSYMSPLTGAEWDYFYSYLYVLHVQPKPAASLNLSYKGGNRSGGTGEIYCVQHNDWPTTHLGRVTPILAGNAADAAKPGQLTDIPAGEPRLLNTRWSELSAIYKIWRQGPRSDIIGFCHYRRLFDFSKPAGHGATQRETVISVSQLPDHTNAYFNEARLNALNDTTIICAAPLVTDVSIWEGYIQSHNTQDYCRLITIISRTAPQLIPHLIAQHHTAALYANNMFICNWTYFDELCSLWFDILGTFEREVPANRGNDYQNRDISFLSERVFDAWIRLKKSQGVAITELPIFFVQ